MAYLLVIKYGDKLGEELGVVSKTMCVTLGVTKIFLGMNWEEPPYTCDRD